MMMKILPTITCVSVLVLSIFGYSFVLGDEPDDDEIQIGNDSGGTLYFDYNTSGRGWEGFEIGSNDIWTLYCRGTTRMQINIDGRIVRYNLRCGNTYELYWNSARGHLGVARVR